MVYLFSYHDNSFILCKTEELGNDEVLVLIKLNDSKVPTDQIKHLKKSTKDIFLQLCDSFINNYTLSYIKLDQSSATISKAIKFINEAFTDLGFTEGCLNGCRLIPGVTCIETVSVKISDIPPEPSELYDQKLLFDNRIKSISAVKGSKRFEFIPCLDSKYNYLVLYGDGGLGKTNFLKLLIRDWGKQRGPVYYCSLSTLLEEAITAPIPKELHCGSDISHAGNTGNFYTSYLFRYCRISKYSGRKCTFLLDGFNELLEKNASHSYDFIQQILKEIAMLKLRDDSNSIYVIITTRNKNDITQLPSFYRSNKIKFATLSGVIDDKELLDIDATDEFKKLISRPLFYQLYKKFKPEDIKKKSVYEIWRTFHKEACRQEYANKNISADEALYIYYIILPLFAHFMETNRSESISRTQAIRLIDKIRNSPAIQESYQNVINSIERETYRSQIQFVKISQFFYDSLRNVGNFISYDKNSLKFKHQDIREYFAAFYIEWYLKSIHSAPLLLELIPNFNLKSTVQSLILDALNFQKLKNGNTDKIKEENKKIKAENDKLYYKIFRNSQILRASADLEEVHSQLYQNLCLTYVAYTFADHFMLHANEKRHNIISPFCESLMKCGRFLAEHPSMLSIKERQSLLEVYTAMIHYYRLKHDYVKCRYVYEFCMKYIADGCDNYYIRMIRHQHGKAMLYNSQDLFTGGEVKSNYYDVQEKSAKEIFDESIKILKSCLPYNMTANILGNLYATPVDWISKNHLLERDVCTAFRIYHDAYQDMKDSNYLYSRNGTEMIYTLRQLSALLIKGHVKLKNGEPTENGVCPLFNDDDDSETMNYAADVLDHIKGQNYPFVDWLRGAVQLYNGNTEMAKKVFENEKNNYMTKIVYLKNHWYEDEQSLRKSIEADLQRLVNNAHTTKICEYTDTSYLLLDAELLGYSI